MSQHVIKEAPSSAVIKGVVDSMFVYPVKSLSAQPLPEVKLSAGQGIPGDRIWALGRSDGSYKPGSITRFSKDEFHVLVKDARLAGVQTHLHDDKLLSVEVSGHLALTADLDTDDGQQSVRAFFTRILDLPAGAEPVVAREPGLRFTDNAELSESMMETVSLINLASVRALEEQVDSHVDPMRFRSNIYFDGLPAFSELDLVGSEISVGSATFTVVMNTLRCAATSVNPVDARRDLAIPQLLMEHFGHSMMGIYGEVTAPGTIRAGDPVSYKPARKSS